MNRIWLVLFACSTSMLAARSVNIDPVIADALREQIATFTDQALAAHSAHDTAQLIKNQYPVVGTIRIDQRSPQGERITIDAARPHALINSEIILDETGRIYSPNALEPAVVKTVPQITLVAEQARVLNELPPEIIEFIINLSYNMLKQFNITWRSHNMISCTCNDNKSPWSVHITRGTTLDKAMMDRCARAARAYTTQGTYKKNKPIILDARFRGQIIARQ